MLFPFRETESLVVTLWTLGFPSYKNKPVKTAPKGLLAIIDLDAGNVIGYREFKLPAFDVLAVSPCWFVCAECR